MLSVVPKKSEPPHVGSYDSAKAGFSLLAAAVLFALGGTAYGADSTNSPKAANTPAADTTVIDADTLANWSAPFRHWHY